MSYVKVQGVSAFFCREGFCVFRAACGLWLVLFAQAGNLTQRQFPLTSDIFPAPLQGPTLFCFVCCQKSHPQNSFIYLPNDNTDVPSHFSRIRLFATPRTVAHQAPLSMGFPRKEYWSACRFLLQGIFCLLCLHQQVGSLPLAPPGKPYTTHCSILRHLTYSIIHEGDLWTPEKFEQAQRKSE